MTDIRILDACCGSRLFWFDKNESHTTFMDIRKEKFNIQRVLKIGGTLIFKWSDCQVNVKEILKVIPFKPLFGQQRGTTHWMTFVKFEETGK